MTEPSKNPGNADIDRALTRTLHRRAEQPIDMRWLVYRRTSDAETRR